MFQNTEVPQTKQLDDVNRAPEIPSGALKTSSCKRRSSAVLMFFKSKKNSDLRQRQANSDGMKESMNRLVMKLDSSFMQLNAKLDILQVLISVQNLPGSWGKQR